MSAKNSTHPNYFWKRFWVENGQTIYLDRDGYLSDPEDEHSGSGSQKIHRSYEEIKHYPVLFLLGEPGIGKSDTIHKLYKQTEKQNKREEQVFYFDLKDYGENDLDSEIIGELKQKLQNYDCYVTLFLDSFDECTLNFNGLAAKLRREFKQLPAELLCVRIACRTAEFPESLRTEMSEHWGKDNVGIFELAPLRRRDVELAASENSIDSEIFLDELNRQEVVPFAIHPITLNFLLNEYKKNKQLPKGKHSIYEMGCKKLCEEFSDSRRDAGDIGKYTTSQRVRTAERIAAVMVLSNRNAIWTGHETECPENNLKYSDLVGYTEMVDNLGIEITESIIKETCQTALFSGYGEQRLGWAHWSYAEFLAAEYLHHSQLDDKKLLKLLCYAGSSEPILELYEVIAWLAIQRSVVRELLIREKPEILLRADLQMFSEEWRETLTTELLERLEQFDIQDNVIREYLYVKLKHPKLAEQLKSYICSEGTFGLARDVAMKIAEVCSEKTVLPVLITVLHDITDNYYRRIEAARVISRIGTDEDKDELRHFLKDREDDPNQEIKAIALNTLWSKMEISTLLDSCTPHLNFSYFGDYLSFCKLELSQILKDHRYLRGMLEWLNKRSDIELQRDCHESFDPHVSGSILLFGWQQYLENQEIQDIYVELTYRFLKFFYLSQPYQETYKQLSYSIAHEQEKRHLLLEKLLAKYVDITWNYLCYNGLIFKEDLVWLQQYAEHSNSAAAKQLFTDLTVCFQRGEEFRQQEETRQLSKNTQESLDKQKLSEYVVSWLDFIESGNPDGWINLCWVLASSKTRNNSLSTSELANVHNFYGWKNANEPTRQRVIEAAKSYVAKPIDNAVEIDEPSICYSAFNLLLSQEKSYLEHLDETQWKSWAPIFAVQLKQYLHEDSEKQQAAELYQFVLTKAQDEFLSAFRQFIEQEEQKDGLAFIGHLPIPTNNEIGTLLLDFVNNLNNIKYPSSVYHIFGKLLTDGYFETRETVLKCTQNCFEIGQSEKAAAGACVLVRHDLKNSWNIIWQMIQEDEVFGKELVADFVKFSCYPHEQLSEQDIANLYIWIEQRFPQRNCPHHTGIYTPTLHDEVCHFARALLSNLTRCGTQEAYQAVERIIHEFPHLIELKRYLHIARDTMYRKSWQPSSPKDLLNYIHNNIIFARTNDELLEIVIESLERLNARLDTIRHILWNNESSWRPKDENSVSDFVKDHLQMDLAKRVIVDREVQVRSRSGKGRGESIDILVHATSRENNKDILSVVIEAKGCWHEKLKESIEKQLAKQYLTTEYTHGIYLVYWFLCDEWDKSHYQKNNCKSHFKTRRELEDFFTEEAKKLSVDSKKIKSYVLNCSINKK